MPRDKSLATEAIDIKGKKYVLVSSRVSYFNETYPNGSITTELLSPIDSQVVVIKATVKPDYSIDRFFTGYSQAVIGDGYINKTSALENAETSAVGRALALMGIGVIDSIASVDEINKATGSTGWQPKYPPKLKSAVKEAKQFEDTVDNDHFSAAEKERAYESTKQTISMLAQTLAKKRGVEINDAQGLINFIGSELGFDLEVDQYANILNALRKKLGK